MNIDESIVAKTKAMADLYVSTYVDMVHSAVGIPNGFMLVVGEHTIYENMSELLNDEKQTVFSCKIGSQLHFYCVLTGFSNNMITFTDSSGENLSCTTGEINGRDIFFVLQRLTQSVQ